MRDRRSEIPLKALETIQAGTLRYTYKGVPCMKNPFDFSLYTKLIHDLAPGSIIEIGTYRGGSALWLADLLRSFGLDGHVYSIDHRYKCDIQDERISFISGNALALSEVLTPDIVQNLKRPLLVIEDSAHAYETSLAVMRFFAPLMSPGEYLLIEDGIVNDLTPLGGVYAGLADGPNRAIAEFLAESGNRFEIDTAYCDFFGYNFTYNTNGYLKCVR
jgi:cephalosporin hydroxylase